MIKQNNNQMIPFQAGTLYDGAEVLSYLSQQSVVLKKAKRAASAYNCFIASTEQRDAVKATNPDISPKEIMSILAVRWKALSDEEKLAFKPITTQASVLAKTKRPPSTYNCFIASVEQRALLKASNPELTPKEMMGALAAVWKTLSNEDKLAFKPQVCASIPPKKKRKPSAYNRFIADTDRRAAIRAANPDVKPKEIMALMAVVWKTLTDEEKSIYQ
jgi:hypothetical protein